MSHNESGGQPPWLLDISADGSEILTNVRIAMIVTRPRRDSTEAIGPVLRRSTRNGGEDRPRRGRPGRQGSVASFVTTPSTQVATLKALAAEILASFVRFSILFQVDRR